MSVHATLGTGTPLAPIRLKIDEFSTRIAADIAAGARLGLLTARYVSNETRPSLAALLLYPDKGDATLLEAGLDSGVDHYPSLTPKVTQAHWFERATHDFFGIRAEGHPRFKSVILHEAWRCQQTHFSSASGRRGNRIGPEINRVTCGCRSREMFRH